MYSVSLFSTRDSVVIMRNIVLIPASMLTLGGSTDVPRQCNSELAMAITAFADFKESYAIFAETASAASTDLPDSTRDRISTFINTGERSLSRPDYNVISDHRDRLIKMMIDVFGAQIVLEEIHEIISSTTLLAHIRSRLGASLLKCKNRTHMISHAEYLCSVKGNETPMSLRDPVVWVSSVALVLLAIAVFKLM